MNLVLSSTSKQCKPGVKHKLRQAVKSGLHGFLALRSSDRTKSCRRHSQPLSGRHTICQRSNLSMA